MGQFTSEDVRRLAGLKGQQGPVVSLYLDVDGQRFPRTHDYLTAFNAMLRRARERSGSQGAAISADLARLEDEIGQGFDRSKVKGLAVFSCAADDWVRRFELPVPVRSHLAVNQTPHVSQLESILEHHQRFGVLLVDRQRARMSVFSLGVLVDRNDVFDQLPRHDDDGGRRDRDQLRDHSEAVAHQHLRRAAQVALAVHQQEPLDHLILAGSDPAMAEVERELHPYLAERVAARCRLATTATDEEIRAAAMRVETDVQRSREERLVARLRDALSLGGPAVVGASESSGPLAAKPRPLGTGSGTAVAGLGPTLLALTQRRVDTLLVSEGYVAAGWRCPGCELLAAVGPRCPQCSTPDKPVAMDQVDDVVEEAVDTALRSGARVAMIPDNPDLDVLGRLGALLRF